MKGTKFTFIKDKKERGGRTIFQIWTQHHVIKYLSRWYDPAHKLGKSVLNTHKEINHLRNSSRSNVAFTAVDEGGIPPIRVVPTLLGTTGHCSRLRVPLYADIQVPTGTTKRPVVPTDRIGTTNPLAMLDLNGGLNFQAISAPAVSLVADGKIYFDSTANKLKVSENGGAYVNLVGGGSGTVTSVTGTAPLSVATGTTTPAISIAQATSAVSGFLTSTDWTTFNTDFRGRLTVMQK